MKNEEAKKIIIQAWKRWKLDREVARANPANRRTFGQWLESKLLGDSYEFAVWCGKQGVIKGTSGTLFLKQDVIEGIAIPKLSSEDIQNWIKEYELLQENEKILGEVIPLITPYLNALSKKRRRMRIKDDYGLIDDSKWQKELNYFFTNAVAPYLEEFTVATLARTLRRVGNNGKFQSGKRSINDLQVVREVLDQYINAALDDHIEGDVDSKIDIALLDPIEYEHFCADLLKKDGWNVQVTQASGDQGIDILAKKDGLLLALQCKKYSNPVGNKAVQEVYSGGTFYKANAFAVVSPVEYTPSAKELANTLGVHLLHHDDLATLTIKDKEQ